MNCPDYELFDRYYNGELSAADSCQFEEHMLKCPECAQKYQALEYSESALRKYKSFFKDTKAPDMLDEILEKCENRLSILDVLQSLLQKPQFVLGVSCAFIILVCVFFYPDRKSEYSFLIPSTCRSGETAFVQYTGQNRYESAAIKVYLETGTETVKLCDYSAPVLIPGEKIKFSVPYSDSATYRLLVDVQGNEYSVPLRIEDRVSFTAYEGENGKSVLEVKRNGVMAKNTKFTLKNSRGIIPLVTDSDGKVKLDRNLLADDFSVKLNNSVFNYSGIGSVSRSSGELDPTAMAYYSGKQEKKVTDIIPESFSGASFESVSGMVTDNRAHEYRKPAIFLMFFVLIATFLVAAFKLYSEKKRVHSMYSDLSANGR